jgi:hypothetical protein
MSIQRITNPVDFCCLIDDLGGLFSIEDISSGHQLLKHNAETIKASFGHAQLLNWDLFVWGNKNNNHYDSCIMFYNDKSAKFGSRIFSEFLWLSKNPKVGYKLFKTAVDFARKQNFEFISMSTVVKHPKHEKIKSFYEKMGFLKDSETYISKL